MPGLLRVTRLATVFLSLGCGMPANPQQTSSSSGSKTESPAPRQVLEEAQSSGTINSDDPAATESPEDVCVILRKLSFEDPERFTERMHPEALQLFRKLVIRVVESNAPDERAVVLGVLFDGITSESELSQRSDAELFTSFRRKVISSMPDEARQLMSKAEVTPIGYVAEGEDVVHVIVRTTLKDTLYRKLEVVSLKRHGVQWFGLMSEELEFNIAQLAAKNTDRQRAE